MKTWRVQYDFENVFFSIPNLARCKTFQSKNDAFWIFFFKIWRVRKIEFKIWLVLKFYSPKSEFYLVFHDLTDWRFFPSTLIATYFKEENKTTMSVVDLVARCSTGICQTSIRLNACKILTENLTCCVFLKSKNDAFNTTLKMYFF